MRIRFVAAICLSICVLFVGLFAYRVNIKRNAVSLLTTAAQVATSNEPDAAFRAVQTRYGNRLKRIEGCTSAECAYEITQSNRLLAALHLAQPTEITLRFALEQDRLWFTMVDYRTNLRSGASPTVHVQTDYCKDCGYVFINPWSNSSDDSENGIVQIGQQASFDKHKVAMGLNPECLTAFHGCRDISEILPTAWERTGTGRMMCRVHNKTGQVEW